MKRCLVTEFEPATESESGTEMGSPKRLRLDYLNLIDFEICRPLDDKIYQDPGLIHIRRLTADGMEYRSTVASSPFPNLLALDLSDTEGTLALFLQNPEPDDDDDDAKELTCQLLSYSQEMYRDYELYTNEYLQNLNEDRVEKAALVLHKRLKVFKVLNLRQNEYFTSDFKMSCLEVALHNAVADHELIIELLNATCDTDLARRSVLSFGRCHTEGRFVMEAALRCRFPLWGFWSRDLMYKAQSERFCPVLTALYERNGSLLNVLFDYGFQVDLRPMAKRTWIDEYYWSFRLFYPSTTTHSRAPETVTSRSVLICAITRGLLINFMEYPSQVPENRRRVAHSTSNRHWHVSIEEYAQCLNLLWRTIPCPYVGQNEFVDAFKVLLGRRRQCLDFSRLVYNVFKAHLPECFGNPQGPRSLMHLSRCVIRRQMQNSWMMPHGVDTLMIPQKLKDYILVKW